MDIHAHFQEHGFYIARGVYSPDEVRAMEADFDRIVDQLLKSDEDVNARWGAGDTVVYHTHQVQVYSAVWLQAIQHPKFLDVAEAILGPDIILHHTKLFQKPPEVGAPFPVHQDWQYFPTVQDTMIAGVIHVSEATEEMGCFRAYPGTHQYGRLDGMMGGGQNREITDQYPIEGATPCIVEPGDVVFFHYFTFHGSMPNRSQKTRKTVLVQMHAGSDEVEPGNRHVYSRLALRGWNHLAKRSTGNIAG